MVRGVKSVDKNDLDYVVAYKDDSNLKYGREILFVIVLSRRYNGRFIHWVALLLWSSRKYLDCCAGD